MVLGGGLLTALALHEVCVCVCVCVCVKVCVCVCVRERERERGGERGFVHVRV